MARKSSHIIRFAGSETGAVVTEWVLATALVALLSSASVFAVSGSVLDGAGSVDDDLAAAAPPATAPASPAGPTRIALD